MGGSSGNTQQTQQQQQTQTTTPWAPAAGALQNIIGQIGGYANLTPTEQGALSGLTGPTSGILGGYLPQQQNVANTLYGGGQNFSPIVNDAYSQFQAGMNPIANASLDPYQTPGFGNALSTAQNDITQQINSQFAGAGRDLSGLNTQTLARGLMQGAAPTIANQYNQNVQNRMGALSGLFGAGGTTAGLLSGLQQTQFGNMQAGAGAAAGAQDIANSQYMQQLAAEAQRRGIPLSVLQAQAGIALPAAQAFGTTSGTSTGTGTGQQQQQMSGAQQFALLSGGLKNALPLMQSGAGLFSGLFG